MWAGAHIVFTPDHHLWPHMLPGNIEIWAEWLLGVDIYGLDSTLLRRREVVVGTIMAEGANEENEAIGRQDGH